MFGRSFAFVLSACLCAALFAGCSGGGSSGTNAAGIPAAGHPANAAAPHGAVRRTANVPVCSGTNPTAFMGTSANVADATYAVTVGGFGNQVCDDYGSIVGGQFNAISTDNDSAYESFIGNGQNNVITGHNAHYSAIVGGLNNTLQFGQYSFIGGGTGNTLTGDSAVLAGGSTNKVSAEYGFVGAGTNNVVSGEGGYVAAGGYNTASGLGAVVDGGFNSTAGGTFATIPGGYENSAAGTYSFAAGARASAAQNGTFVWSDGSDGDATLTSTRAYEFLARASGGVTFWTNAASTVGATLAPGSGTWASASDRNLKTDVVRVDDAAVLDKVSALPISRWSYKSEHGVRHVGPMAQDFYAAFGVGEDDKHITSIDEDGVALAAIKALHARVGALGAENAALRSQLAALKTSQAQHDLLVDRRLQRLTVAVAGSRRR